MVTAVPGSSRPRLTPKPQLSGPERAVTHLREHCRGDSGARECTASCEPGHLDAAPPRLTPALFLGPGAKVPSPPWVRELRGRVQGQRWGPGRKCGVERCSCLTHATSWLYSLSCRLFVALRAVRFPARMRVGPTASPQKGAAQETPSLSGVTGRFWEPKFTKGKTNWSIFFP